MNVFPVILCGGSGTRLWPASRLSRPKQFISLINDESLFEQTVRRLHGLEGFKELVVVSGVAHHHWLTQQLAGKKVSSTILLEPQARDSAPAIAAAVSWIAERDPNAIAVILASDHYIPDRIAFQVAINRAVKTAQDGRIVTLGVRPTKPSSAYGYIRAEDEDLGAGAAAVAEFAEKPNIKTAAEYIAKGYYWNSGNFIAQASTLVDEIKYYVPQVEAAAKAAINNAIAVSGGYKLGAEFIQAPKVSFDYAVMEKTNRAAILPVNLIWSDLGAWDAVLEATERDDKDNAVIGDAVLIDTQGCLVRANSSLLVATVGLRDLAIIVEDDAVLVCNVKTAQAVKTVVSKLKEDGRHQQVVSLANEGIGGLPDLLSSYQDWLFTKALPLWWTLGADHSGWGFHESLDSTGKPTDALRRARVQPRQAYSFALAGRLGWPGPWQNAVAHGLDALETHYKRKDGLYRTLVSPDGTIHDDTAFLYDQAFVLLALAAATPIRANTEVKALLLLSHINETMRHSNGGFREVGPYPFQSNAHMHLLEAALAWIEIGEHYTVWFELAVDIVELALNHFIDASGGFLREFYDSEWVPELNKNKCNVEPGHQFEWTWLLLRWGRLSGDLRASGAARQLYRAGKSGVDINRNVAVDSLYDDLSIASNRARLWPQTERMKAALILSESCDDVYDRTAFANDAIMAARSLQRYLEVPAMGLWRDSQLETGAFADEPSPASTFYHITSAIFQLRETVSAHSASTLRN